MKQKLTFFVSEFWHFGINQAKASLFAGSMLAAILATKWLWPADALIHRYDFLFVYALLIQGVFILLKLESWEEARVILVFHVVGTVMEIFKTHMGSWSYPEPSLIHIAGVPLFSGFMYSAVGSYIARVWRIFEFRFDHFPKLSHMAISCALIYINFFSHHYIYDFRYILFLLIGLLFYKTRIYYKPHQTYYWMPILLSAVLTSFFIWLAENIGTLGTIWIYPSQKAGWHIVSLSKMGSWFLLMNISFVLVSLLHREPSDSHDTRD